MMKIPTGMTSWAGEDVGIWALELLHCLGYIRLDLGAFRGHRPHYLVTFNSMTIVTDCTRQSALVWCSPVTNHPECLQPDLGSGGEGNRVDPRAGSCPH